MKWTSWLWVVDPREPQLRFRQDGLVPKHYWWKEILNSVEPLQPEELHILDSSMHGGNR